MTDYVILRLIEESEGAIGEWQQYAGLIEASSPARALRIANHGTGTFVAVPKRSWKPLTVKTEQVTKVTIG